MSKRFSRWLIAGLVLAAGLSLAGCTSSSSKTQTPAAPAQTDQTAPPEVVIDPALTQTPAKMADVTELKTEDIVQGTGAEATAGSSVTVHYTGWLTNGTKFDSSVDRGEPFGFPLGGGQVIAGWDQGVQGMKVGGVRKLTIPAGLGYGEQGAGGDIPPNATLVFVVQLVDVQ